MLNIDSRLSLGLYAMDLWELDQAKTAFNTVIDLGQNTPHQAWAEKATVALALTYACQNQTEQAQIIASKYLHKFTQQSQQSGRLAYFIQLLGQTYEQLGNIEQAEALYQQALHFAEAGHYLQVKDKSLTGLANIARQRQQMAVALNYHTQSIDLFKSIEAKCDLANDYVELGHSHIYIKQLHMAHHHWKQALSLYADIHAHKQVSRVRTLLDNAS